MRFLPSYTTLSGWITYLDLEISDNTRDSTKETNTIIENKGKRRDEVCEQGMKKERRHVMSQKNEENRLSSSSACVYMCDLSKTKKQ